MAVLGEEPASRALRAQPWAPAAARGWGGLLSIVYKLCHGFFLFPPVTHIPFSLKTLWVKKEMNRKCVIQEGYWVKVKQILATGAEPQGSADFCVMCA